MPTMRDDATEDPRRIIAALRRERDAALTREATLAGMLAQRNSDHDERAAHQAATVEVLKAMSASPGDPQPVFDLICRQARRLLDVQNVGLFEFDGTRVHYRADSGTADLLDPRAFQELRAAYPMEPMRSSLTCRAILDGEIIHIPDLAKEPDLSTFIRRLGHRSQISVPLMRDGRAIGALTTASMRVDDFSDGHIALLKTFAEQAVIAITNAETYRALQTRTADLRASLEYQTATSDVLKVISRSTFDLRPVLNTVAETAARLCDAEQAAIFRREGDLWRLAVNFGFPPEFEAYHRGRVPFAFDPDNPSASMVAAHEGRIVHLHDAAAIPGYPEMVLRLGKHRTTLGVPLMREGAAIGVIMLARQRVEPFTQPQIELVSTFADQAVIAIENTRLLTEQQEALEQQTATAEVLRVINESPGDLMPVFDAIVQRAIRLCAPAMGALSPFDGEKFQFVVMQGYPRAYVDHMRDGWRSTPGGNSERVMREGGVLHVADIVADPGYETSNNYRAMHELAGVRTLLLVPLRTETASLGLFTLSRQEVRPFTSREIDLVRNFAAQAVIAMENARLINEQREALEQQTATAEVLQVINESPGRLKPVFDAMLEKAVRLCGPASGVFSLYDGSRFQVESMLGVPPAYAAHLAPGWVSGSGGWSRAMIDGRLSLQIDDVAAEPDYIARSPNVRAMVELGGVRSTLWLALRKDDQLRGLFTMFRQEVRPFTGKEIALLENFAAQAVIAMENARLLTEQHEALERQTATAEVLGVINANPGNLAPVFNSILEKALTLSDSAFGMLSMFDGQCFRAEATRNLPPSLLEFSRQGVVAEPGTLLHRLVLGETVVQLHDAKSDDLYRSGQSSRRLIVDVGGARSMVLVALRKDDVLLGAINIFRREVRPFTDKETALLGNFAAQAVIAMENARLLTEQREALEQQTATAEVLQVINASPGDLPPVFDAMLEKAMRLCGAAFGSLYTYDGERFHTAAQRGLPPAYAAYRRENPPKPVRGGGPATLLETGRTLHIVDITDHELHRAGNPMVRAMVELGGIRTILTVPLIKDDRFLGYFSIYRQEVRAFSDKQIALLENFAAQAVIAMENARLLSELREALEQQTATAEVLRVINASPGNLTPVFDAVLEKGLRLIDAAFGGLWVYEGDMMRIAATRGMTSTLAEFRARSPVLPIAPVARRTTETRRGVQILDVTEGDGYRAGAAGSRAVADLGGARTILVVPLLTEHGAVGNIQVYRQEVRAFTDQQVALLENFAAQAVIAMENARLLTEQREALRQQTATAEVLQVINGSPGDLRPVFDAVLEKAMRLCEAAFGAFNTYDGERFQTVATHGVPAAYATFRANNPPISHPGGGLARVLATKRPLHVLDITGEEAYRNGNAITRAVADLAGARTVLVVPLLKEDAIVGIITIFRQEVRAFSDKQIALVENFAAQAVIAMENARLLSELRESLEQQTATAEVLQVINASPGDLTPVFDAMLERAHHICDASMGALATFDGTHFRAVATRGYTERHDALIRQPFPPNAYHQALLRGERFAHLLDARTGSIDDAAISRSVVENTEMRTGLTVPLRKDGVLLGFISAWRVEVRAFTDKQIALLENFAAQAVIAMENARLLTEQREALEQQTATAEVLQVINANPGNLSPVFKAILERAHHVCGAEVGGLILYRDGLLHAAATRGFPLVHEEFLRRPFPPNAVHDTLIAGARLVHIPDMRAVPMESDNEVGRNLVERTDLRACLMIPLRKDGTLLGFLSAYRFEPRAFAEKEIALLENFAAQAVIAMDNARLLNEIRERQEELRITFENMGDGVALFDDARRLVAWNRRFQDILDVPDEAVAGHPAFSDYIRYLAERGEYGAGADPEAQIHRLEAGLGQSAMFERTRPNGRVIEVRHNPIPSGGFVVIYADITERKRNEEALRAARDAAEEASRTIEAAYRDLKIAQANLVQAEKMASLGQLTAGIAHEIKNPLNFVNNFASLSVELLDELKQTAAPAFATLDDEPRADVEDLTETLTANLKKIEEHGKRADGIVRSMLEHSRGSSAERRAVDINALVDEALNLAYHGARAQDQSFNITLQRNLADGIAPIEVNPQDLTRVFLNLFSNGFYAATRRARDAAADFQPSLAVATRDLGDRVEVRVRDNGTGIPDDIREKLFQPFFTTKPTGEGTGLGLSITYDIVTKQHGGTISVESAVGDFTEFTVTLPRQMFVADGGRP